MQQILPDDAVLVEVALEHGVQHERQMRGDILQILRLLPGYLKAELVDAAHVEWNVEFAGARAADHIRTIEMRNARRLEAERIDRLEDRLANAIEGPPERTVDAKEADKASRRAVHRAARGRPLDRGLRHRLAQVERGLPVAIKIGDLPQHGQSRRFHHVAPVGNLIAHAMQRPAPVHGREVGGIFGHRRHIRIGEHHDETQTAGAQRPRDQIQIGPNVRLAHVPRRPNRQRQRRTTPAEPQDRDLGVPLPVRSRSSRMSMH